MLQTIGLVGGGFLGGLAAFVTVINTVFKRPHAVPPNHFAALLRLGRIVRVVEAGPEGHGKIIKALPGFNKLIIVKQNGRTTVDTSWSVHTSDGLQMLIKSCMSYDLTHRGACDLAILWANASDETDFRTNVNLPFQQVVAEVCLRAPSNIHPRTLAELIKAACVRDRHLQDMGIIVRDVSVAEFAVPPSVMDAQAQRDAAAVNATAQIRAAEIRAAATRGLTAALGASRLTGALSLGTPMASMVHASTNGRNGATQTNGHH